MSVDVCVSMFACRCLMLSHDVCIHVTCLAFPYEIPTSGDARFVWVYSGRIAQLLHTWGRVLPEDAIGEQQGVDEGWC